MGGKLSNGNKISFDKANLIVENIKKVIGNEGVYVAGSLRREKELVGDLDIIVVREEASSDLNSKLKLLTGKDLSKRKTCSFVFEEVQVDLNICNSDIKGSYLLHWTGSTRENVRLRRVAKKLGCKLSQNGLINKSNVNLSKFKTEKEIYGLLGLKYVEPKNR